MDPPIVNESSFSVANPSSYSLAEIWPFPLNGNADGGGLGLRMGTLTGFGDAAPNRDASLDESTVTDQSGSGKKPKDAISEDESSKLVSTCSDIDLKNSGNKRKVSGSKDGKTEETGFGDADQKDKPAEPPKDYIHVRARRGQATDSHSLAERARREKISERMKILQDLVPGCNKVIGKALVLDEIINYIQSLQRQVEFLSMKLEAVNSRPEPIMEGFPAKSMGPASFDAAAGMVYGSGAAAARDYSQGTQPDWLHMQVGSSFERAT